MPFLPPRGLGARPGRNARSCPPNVFQSLATLALAFGLGICSAPSAQALSASAPLTLADALQAAEGRSAALQGQDAAAKSLREMAVSAGRLPDPVLRLSVDNLPIDGPMRYSLTDDFMTMRSVGLVQTFVGAQKREARSHRYVQEADATSMVRAMQLTKLRTQTGRAWFECYFQGQMLALLEEQREETALAIDGAEAAYRGGRGAQADVFAARAAMTRIDIRLHEVRADLANAESLLQRWVGDAATQPLGAPPPIDRLNREAGELARRVEQFPDVAILTAKEAVLLAEAEVARQEKSADWSWSLMVSKRGSRFSDMLSVGVSIPLQWDQKNRQDRELVARLERVEQVRADREELQREQLAQVQRMATTWRSNLLRLQDYDASMIPLATDRMQAQEVAFAGGKVPLSAVLEARRMVIDTRVERLRIEQATAALWSELEFLMPESAALDDISTDPHTDTSPENKP